MSDATTTVDQDELASDAQFNDTLERVSFQPGILLGSEALTAEQAYHLRRLTRHQRWLIGPGTVFGLRVDAMTPANDPTDVRLTVGPGYAIDGLGREVLVNEGYAISLRDWLATENASPDVAGNFVGGTLFLRVTVRSRAAPQALQPVVSELFDAGLDPVVAARVADSFLLEVTGDARQMGDAPARPLDSWSPDHTTPCRGRCPGYRDDTGAGDTVGDHRRRDSPTRSACSHGCSAARSRRSTTVPARRLATRRRRACCSPACT